MKTKKVLSIIIVLVAIMMFNYSKALTISSSDLSAKKGQEMVVTITTDEFVSMGQGVLKYDEKKLEFLGTKTTDLEITQKENGKVAWMYINSNYFNKDIVENGNYEQIATKKIEFTFKVKETGKNIIKYENMKFVQADGNEIDSEEINGKHEIIINKNGFTMIFLLIIIIIILVISIPVIGNKNKNKKKRK